MSGQKALCEQGVALRKKGQLEWRVLLDKSRRQHRSWEQSPGAIVLISHYALGVWSRSSDPLGLFVFKREKVVP